MAGVVEVTGREAVAVAVGRWAVVVAGREVAGAVAGRGAVVAVVGRGAVAVERFKAVTPWVPMVPTWETVVGAVLVATGAGREETID